VSSCCRMAATLRNFVFALLACLASGLKWELNSTASLLQSSASKFWNAGYFWNEVQNASIGFLGSSDGKNLGYELKLRICNAYPQELPYDVYINEKKIQEGLRYADCFQYTDELRSGDKINFRVEALQAGSFTIDTLPHEDATLLLVILRHDSKTVAAKFLSHVYAALKDPQIAVLDAYQGDAEPEIQLAVRGAAISEDAVPQTLKVGSVIAIDEGAYDVTLAEAGDKQKKYELDTWGQEAYAIIRCGTNSSFGETYPEELLVFPRHKLAEPEDGNHTKSSSLTKADIEEDHRSAANVALPSFLLLVIAFCALKW